ncbi:hypothetical protein ACFWM3_21275 [Gottfriedia sp. NPDC058432]|uniref:hypothetical protein n=1 Tax=Gottfriedia sp. NPDC058432 TaxID=3346497 RepID=UPI003661A3F7
MLGSIIFIFLLFLNSYQNFSSRKRGEGVYWDEKRVVVDLTGNSIFWDEIEEIGFYKQSFFGMTTKSTYIRVFIYKEEQVRLRHKLPLKNIFWRYSGNIDWNTIEKPKEMHEALMQFCEEKNNSNSI